MQVPLELFEPGKNSHRGHVKGLFVVGETILKSLHPTPLLEEKLNLVSICVQLSFKTNIIGSSRWAFPESHTSVGRKALDSGTSEMLK